MSRYIMRLDDASEYMDVKKWERMKALLDQYHINPILGIIPDNQDETLISAYEKDNSFWKKMRSWIEDGWTPALHGCEHRYVTEEGGCNPVNARSEFAGLPYDEQAEKIHRGYEKLKAHGILPEIFFAPSHTFDAHTLLALKNETPIRVISDTIANDVYKSNGFWFIPQQSGVVRKLPFKVVTFCYHPNTMEEKDFDTLQEFLREHEKDFCEFHHNLLKERSLGTYDRVLRWLYFAKRRKK